MISSKIHLTVKWCNGDYWVSSPTKPVIGVSDKVRLKPAFSATETSYRFEILSYEASLGIRLCICTFCLPFDGWIATTSCFFASRIDYYESNPPPQKKKKKKTFQRVFDNAWLKQVSTSTESSQNLELFEQLYTSIICRYMYTYHNSNFMDLYLFVLCYRIDYSVYSYWYDVFWLHTFH